THALPLLLRVRFGYARVFMNARDLHFMRELDCTFADQAGNGRGGWRLWSRCERNMSLSREETGGGIESDPSGARQVHLCPGVQIGEIIGSACRTFKRFDVGFELNQITGNEA